MGVRGEIDGVGAIDEGDSDRHDSSHDLPSPPPAIAPYSDSLPLPITPQRPPNPTSTAPLE